MPVTVGGPAAVAVSYPANSLTLRISEDAYQGNAQFLVLVDGVQVGGTQTAVTSHSAGLWQSVTVSGNFSSNPNTVTVQFINDAWGGSLSLDRNLYVQSLTIDGSVYAGSTAVNNAHGIAVGGASALYTNGNITFNLPETLTLSVSEDAYQGDAQFRVLVDGVQVGGIQTATASHAAGNWQSVALSGDFGSNPSQVSVQFLNDAWGGSAAADRNLYVQSLTLNGHSYTGTSGNNQAGGLSVNGAAALDSNGSLTFSVGAAPAAVAAVPQSIGFDTNQYLTLGNKLQYDSSQAWSVGTQIEVGAPAPGPTAGLPDGGASLIFGNTNGDPYQGYELWIDDGGDLRVRIMSDFETGHYIDVAGVTNVADGKMHFIGATYDGSSSAGGVKLYVDGVQQQTQTISDTLNGSSASNGPMIIGNQLNGWQNQFQMRGDMFNFALSNVARGAAYFQAASPMATMDSQTKVALNFASGSGLVASDLSGNSNNATLSSTAQWQPQTA